MVSACMCFVVSACMCFVVSACMCFVVSACMCFVYKRVLTYLFDDISYLENIPKSFIEYYNKIGNGIKNFTCNNCYLDLCMNKSSLRLYAIIPTYSQEGIINKVGQLRMCIAM